MRWFIILAGLVLDTLIVGSAIAQAPLPTGQSLSVPGNLASQLDVVFVIDHSGSMWGHPDYNSGPNDSDGNRAVVVKNFMERLAYDASVSGRVHRITVINYNSRILVPLERFEISQSQSQANPLGRPKVVDRVSGVADRAVRALREREYPFTDTPAALRRAVDEVVAMVGTGGRQSSRKVLLITDGRPYRTDTSLSSLRREIRAATKELKDTGAELWVVGLNDASNYWQVPPDRHAMSDGAFWRATSDGRQRLAGNSFPLLREVVRSITDAWLGRSSQPVSVGDMIALPPYLGAALFNIDFDRPGANVSVVDPSGGKHTTGVNSTATFNQVLVTTPEPGDYLIYPDQRIGYQSTLYSTAVDMLAPQVELIGPVGRPYVGEETEVALRVIGEDDDPITMAASDVVATEMWIVDSTGARTSLGQAQHIGSVFKARWTPRNPGEHRVELQVDVLRNGRRQPLFFGFATDPISGTVQMVNTSSSDGSASVVVSSALPLNLVLKAPALGETIDVYWPFGDWPVTVQLQLLDGQGQVISDPGPIVGDTGTMFVLQQVDDAAIERETFGAMIYLSNGTWQADVPLRPALGLGHGWWWPAEIRLRVKPRHLSFGSNQYDLRGLVVSDPGAGPFIRADGFTFGPVTMQVPPWLIAIPVCVAVMLILAAVAFWVYAVVPNRIVRGMEDHRKGRLELVVYENASEMTRRNGRAFNVTGRARYRLDGQIQVNQGSEWTAIPKLFYRRQLRSRTHPTASIRYRLPGAKKTREKRVSARGQPTRLAGGSGVEMFVELRHQRN